MIRRAHRRIQDTGQASVDFLSTKSKQYLFTIKKREPWQDFRSVEKSKLGLP